MTKETKKDANESFRDSFKGKNYWIKKLKPKYENFLRACFLFIHLSYKKPGLIVKKCHLLWDSYSLSTGLESHPLRQYEEELRHDSFCNRLLTCW